MGGVGRATKAQRLSLPKGSKAKINNKIEKINKKRADARAEANAPKEPLNGTSERTAPQAPLNVKSERVESTKAASEPKSQPARAATPTGPARITAPGPTASQRAAAKAKEARKGTKNTSTIKVAEAAVSLDDGPNFGKPVYTITDIPRQWNK
jgi:hypothetical protein